MSKPNITVTIEHDGHSYTATMDRSSKSERPVRIERGDGQVNTDGEWDGGIWGVSTGGEGEWPSEVITLLDAAMEAAYRKALRAGA